MNKRPYAGKIENKGAMQVKAPIAQKAVKKPTVKSGGDLRCGKSGKYLPTNISKNKFSQEERKNPEEKTWNLKTYLPTC